MTITELGTALQKRRKQLKVKQHDLAELAGVSLRTVIAIENGEANPSFDSLSKVADVLGMTIQIQVKK